MGQLIPADCRYQEPSECVKVQLWKYNPEIFGKAGCVDPVSLACSLREQEDERVEMCIEEMMEGCYGSGD